VAGYRVNFTFTFYQNSVSGRKVLKLLKYIFSDATLFQLRKMLQVRRFSLEIVGCFEILRLLRRRVTLGDLARENNAS
jgi:hypothetical protein